MSKTAYVTVPAGTTTANMRKRPNKKADLVKRITKGTVVEVLEQADGWSKIQDPTGDRGYMMSEFLKELAYADEDAPEAAEDAQQQASESGFEQEVLERLTRIEERLNAIDGSVG